MYLLTIEHLFGMLKRWFRCLFLEIILSPDKVCEVIVPTAILHNICSNMNDRVDRFTEVQEDILTFCLQQRKPYHCNKRRFNYQYIFQLVIKVKLFLTNFKRLCIKVFYVNIPVSINIIFSEKNISLFPFFTQKL